MIAGDGSHVCNMGPLCLSRHEHNRICEASGALSPVRIADLLISPSWLCEVHVFFPCLFFRSRIFTACDPATFQSIAHHSHNISITRFYLLAHQFIIHPLLFPLPPSLPRSYSPLPYPKDRENLSPRQLHYPGWGLSKQNLKTRYTAREERKHTSRLQTVTLFWIPSSERSARWGVSGLIARDILYDTMDGGLTPRRC